MSDLVTAIVNKQYNQAESMIARRFYQIMEQKLLDRKKLVAAKMMAEARSYGAVDGALDAASFIPGPAGSVASLASAGASLSRGDYVGAALDAAGALPVVGYAAKAAKMAKMARSASKLGKASKLAKGSKALRKAGKLGKNLDGGSDNSSGSSSAPDTSMGKMQNSPTGTESKLKVNVNGKSMNEEELHEARVKIVKARIRGGKIQRRKKVSNVSGMTIRGGKLTRMSPAERRKRKMGARKAKVKRKSKMGRALMKRKRSMMKRKAMGL